MDETPLSENRFFHIIATTFGVIFLGLMSYFAYTIQDTSKTIGIMAEHVSNIDKKIDEGFAWEGKRIDDHEIRIRTLEEKHVR